MKSLALVAAAVIGGAIGGLVVHTLGGDEPVRRSSGDARRDAPARDYDEEIADLRAQIAELRDRPVGTTVAQPGAGPSVPIGRDGDVMLPGGDKPGGGAGQPEVRTPNEVVSALLGKRFGHNESNRLFGWLTLNKEKIGDVIKALENEVKQDPENAELQVALATAYVAHLTNNVPQGPQQGIAWMKASAAYDAAIKVDPQHWQARFGKAFGTSMAPEFIGLRPEAIRQFEELKKVQQAQAPQSHFAQTYFRLGTLYKDAGNSEKARAIWDEGLTLFPNNDVLKGTLEASTKK